MLCLGRRILCLGRLCYVTRGEFVFQKIMLGLYGCFPLFFYFNDLISRDL